MEDAYQIELRSKANEGETKQKKKTKKIIDLKGKQNFKSLACDHSDMLLSVCVDMTGRHVGETLWWVFLLRKNKNDN